MSKRTKSDLELIDSLSEDIVCGNVVVLEEPNDIVAEIEKNYPFKYSGIDWSDENYIRTLNVRNQEPILKQIYVENFLREIENNYPELGSEKVTVVGDYMTNLAFEMHFAHFVTVHKEFFSIPQDTYIWFPTSKKCINYTFEDELFFG